MQWAECFWGPRFVWNAARFGVTGKDSRNAACAGGPLGMMAWMLIRLCNSQPWHRLESNVERSVASEEYAGRQDEFPTMSSLSARDDGARSTNPCIPANGAIRHAFVGGRASPRCPSIALPVLGVRGRAPGWCYRTRQPGGPHCVSGTLSSGCARGRYWATRSSWPKSRPFFTNAPTGTGTHFDQGPMRSSWLTTPGSGAPMYRIWCKKPLSFGALICGSTGSIK